MTPEDFKYRQGRSQRQQEANSKLAMVAAGGLFLVLFSLLIFNLIKHGL